MLIAVVCGVVAGGICNKHIALQSTVLTAGILNIIKIFAARSLIILCNTVCSDLAAVIYINIIHIAGSRCA